MEDTSQRNYAGFGLMDYRYRFLSTSLGRFIQPDSIIPDLTNPQSLNRYSYTNNNPINYNDPTGHYMEQACGFGGGDCGSGGAPADISEEIEFGLLFGGFSKSYRSFKIELLNYGGAYLSETGYDLTENYSGNENNDQVRLILQQYVVVLASTTNTNTNEIQASTVELAIVLGADIEDLIAVLSGHEGEGWEFNLTNWEFRGDFTSNIRNLAATTNLGPYQTFSTLDVGAERMGMNETYADPLIDSPTNNQVHHIWFYVQLGYYKSPLIATIGNQYHEVWSNDGGQSQADINAGNWGFNAGDNISYGVWDLYDLAVHIREDLGQ